jgi:DNA-binding SARP family transcriptional activator/tetratricopeptide (TPR) repeat protein/DNA-binding transcriptional ArsR family regulator
MEIRALGPVEVRLNGRVEVLSGRLQRTLLGLLVVRAGQPVSVDTLVDALWGEQPDARAGQNLLGSDPPDPRRKLQLHVHRLRGLLDDPDRLSFDGAGYRLRVAPDELDAHRFEALITSGAAEDTEPQRAIDVLRSALSLWRGTPFTDVETPAVVDWARRLAEVRLTGIEAMYRAQLAVGLHGAVISELTALVAEYPLRERLHGLLMTALHRAGQQAEALAVYQRARRTLVEELGIEPGPELRELHALVLAGERSADSGVPAHLPPAVHGFVGRDGELAELDAARSSLVVLAGTAGVGKTALAMRWAHQVRDRFPDGQLYVDLHGYGPDEPVPAADALAGFLRALGLDGAAIPEDLGERAARFRTMVDGQRVLVVLDNARTVDQVRPLLAASPTCFTLITSRDTLAGLVAREGAHRIGLERLPARDATGLLRGLLGTRADLDPAAIDVLVERCARLPLALRIAAELIRSRPGRAIGDLAGELAEAPDALDLLDIEGDPHSAVRAVFSWSYRNLDPAVARTFRLLGLHPGHETDAGALAAMADTGPRDTRRALGVLVRAHLVDEMVDGRYRSHDLLRAYAVELAQTADPPAERDAAVARLRTFYLAMASAAMDVVAPFEAERRPKVTPPVAGMPGLDDYHAGMDWLGAERENLLAATQHADPRYVVAMSETVWRFLTIGGYHDDALALYNHALQGARTLGDAAAEANAQRVLGSAKLSVGLVASAADHLARALALYRQTGDRSLQAATLTNIGVAHWRQGRMPEAADSFRQTLAIYEELGNQRMQMPAMSNLARLRSLLGDQDEAFDLLSRALVIARENGNRPGESSVLAGLAHVGIKTGRPQEALGHAQDALTTARDAGHRSFEGTALRMLGLAHHGLGEHGAALGDLDSSLRVVTGLGEPEEIMATLSALAAVHASLGDHRAALRRYREALATENAREYLDEYAHALAGLGDTHATLGDHDQAREHWRQALTLYRELGMPQADETTAKVGR